MYRLTEDGPWLRLDRVTGFSVNLDGDGLCIQMDCQPAFEVASEDPHRLAEELADAILRAEEGDEEPRRPGRTTL